MDKIILLEGVIYLTLLTWLIERNFYALGTREKKRKDNNIFLVCDLLSIELA